MASEDNKIILYIDNSNIFRGCKKSGWRPSYRKVCDYIKENEGPLFDIHFFASEQEVPREKQSRFYRALQKDLGFSLHTFKLAHRKVTCPSCGKEEWIPTEKGVDVGLVTQLMKDLQNMNFDKAFVMSSDRDYLASLIEVKEAGRDINIIAWKWTLPQETIELCKEKNINMLFLEDYQEELEKPQGEVL